MISGLVVVVDGGGNAVFLDAERLDAGGELVALDVTEGVVDCEIDALDHRGQDGARVQVVLVGIDADRELLVVGSRLQNAETGCTGCRVDDVRALVDLVLGELAAANRVVPGSTGRAGHVLEDFDRQP